MSAPVDMLATRTRDVDISALEVELLGPPAVRIGSLRRSVPGRQGAVLAALAMNAGRCVLAERLADVVWGDEPPAEANNALHKRMSRLRGVVDPDGRGEVLVQFGGGYVLHLDEDHVDVRRFEALAAAGRAQLSERDYDGAEVTFTRALEMWRGAALEGFADEPWAMGESLRLTELRLKVIEDRLQALLAQGAHDQVVGDLVDLTVVHPLRERLRAQLMLAYYRLGRQAEALAVYDETRRLLAEEMGVDPGPELREVHQQILTQDEGLTAAGTAPAPAKDDNLPAPRRSIVGLDHVLGQVAQLLNRVRLLTLTGPGGAGKTTMAIEAARRHERPADGVWLVSLATMSTAAATPAAVAAAVSDALALHGGGLGTTVDEAAVLRALAPRRLLLVLDNCEHLLDAISPFVEELLAAAPDVQVLATSRERLSVTGEVVWSVPGLGYPDDEQATTEQIAAAPAVRLLVERARDHEPDFAIDQSNAAAAATLTRRLDGIPLAIELAASRLRVMSMGEVVSALEDRFRVLAVHGRTVASRHRTLRATLDWSWDLLTPPLQRSLVALAVPARRFDLRMASGLLAAAEVEMDALEVVAALVDHSLLIPDTSAEPTRYRMLESIQDYGRQRITELGLAEAVHAAHADAVESVLHACQSPLSAERFDVDIDRLEAWLDDARIALQWAQARGDRRRMQRLAGGLGWLWLLRGLSIEGLRWLDLGLDQPGGVDPEHDNDAALLWASALRAAGTHTDGRSWAAPAVAAAATPINAVLAQVCMAGHEANAGDLDAAFAALDTAVEKAEVLGGWPLGFVRLIAGQLAWASGQVDQARSHAESAVALLGAAGADWAHTHALETLIDHAIDQGDHRHAHDLAAQALQLCRRQRYPELAAAMLAKLGLASHELGAYDDAERLLDEAVRDAAEVGSIDAQVEAHLSAGGAARRRQKMGTARAHLKQALFLAEGHAVGDRAQIHIELVHSAAAAPDPAGEAAAHASEALALAQQLGDPRTMVRLAEGLASVIAGTGELEAAVRLLASAALARAAFDISSSPSEQRDSDSAISLMCSGLGRETLDRLWVDAQTKAADSPLPTLERLVAAHARRPGR